MRRRSKLIRFFSLFLVVFSCLSSVLVASAEDLPVMSPAYGLGGASDAFITSPSSVSVSSTLSDPGDEDPSVVASILDFFSDIGNWFVDFTPDIMAMFYTPGVDSLPGKLTLFGVIALLGLGFVLIFLLFYLVSSFLCFRN